MLVKNMSWKDNDDLKFWCWAYINDAQSYIDASNAYLFTSDTSEFKYGNELKKYFEKRNILRYKDSISKYHLVAVLGSLIRTLNRVREISEEIEAVCAEAVHLFAEGPELRNMIEHADEYFDMHLEKDRSKWSKKKKEKYSRFIRSSSGLIGVSADATSVIIGDGAHWLGGRFCVEISVKEVQRIYDIALVLPVPSLELNTPPVGNLLD